MGSDGNVAEGERKRKGYVNLFCWDQMKESRKAVTRGFGGKDEVRETRNQELEYKDIGQPKDLELSPRMV